MTIPCFSCKIEIDNRLDWGIDREDGKTFLVCPECHARFALVPEKKLKYNIELRYVIRDGIHEYIETDEAWGQNKTEIIQEVFAHMYEIASEWKLDNNQPISIRDLAELSDPKLTSPAEHWEFFEEEATADLELSKEYVTSDTRYSYVATDFFRRMCEPLLEEEWIKYCSKLYNRKDIENWDVYEGRKLEHATVIVHKEDSFGRESVKTYEVKNG